MHLYQQSLWAVFILLGTATLPMLVELFVLSAASLLPERSTPDEESTLPRINRMIVIVPGHNEENAIVPCIKSIVASSGRPDAILVVAHNCTDATARLATAAGADVLTLNNPLLNGKGHALYYGFKAAFETHHADAVLVIDADSTISPNLIPTVHKALETSYAVQCRYDFLATSGRASSRLRAFGIHCMNRVRAIGRSNLRISCGIHGTGMAFRKEILKDHPYRAQSLVEDLEFHLTLVARGIKVKYLGHAVVQSEAPLSHRAERIQSARWEGGRLRHLLSLGPRVLMCAAGSPLGALEPLLDLATPPLSIGVLLLCVIAFVPLPAAHWYAAAGFAVLGLHISAGLRISDDPVGDALSLLSSPVHVVKKLVMVPLILRMSRANARWNRTPRVDMAPTKATRG